MEISILGRKTPIRTNEDDRIAQEVIDIAQARIAHAEEKIKAANIASTPSNVLILSLLELTEEYVKAKHRFEVFQDETNLRLEKLLNQVQPHKRK